MIGGRDDSSCPKNSRVVDLNNLYLLGFYVLYLNIYYCHHFLLTTRIDRISTEFPDSGLLYVCKVQKYVIIIIIVYKGMTRQYLPKLFNLIKCLADLLAFNSLDIYRHLSDWLDLNGGCSDIVDIVWCSVVPAEGVLTYIYSWNYVYLVCGLWSYYY